MALAIGPAISFVDKIGEVQVSAGRLGSPVFPGETQRVEMWRDGKVISFRVRIPERDHFQRVHESVIERLAKDGLI